MRLKNLNTWLTVLIILISILFNSLNIFIDNNTSENTDELIFTEPCTKTLNYTTRVLEDSNNSSKIIIQYKETSVFPEIENLLCLNKIDSIFLSKEKIEITVTTSTKFLKYLKSFGLIAIIILNYLSHSKYIIFVLNLFFFNLLIQNFYNFFNSLPLLIFETFLICFLYLLIKKYSFYEKNKSHLREVDGLRGVAVLAVLANHLDPNILKSGYLGVDVFFVISGFVISKSLNSYDYKNIFKSLSTFYFKRIKRLIPALYVMVSTVSVFVYIYDFNFLNTINTGKWALIALSNFYLFNISSNYFSSESYLNSFTHTWSLGIEEQFYLIFPFLFFFIHQKKSKYLFLSIFISSLTLYFVYFDELENGVYYLLPFRLWEILLGALVFIYFGNKKYKINFNLTPIILFLIIFIFFLPKDMAKINTILVCAAVSFLIFCVNNFESKNAFLSNKNILYIGYISYSLYLWHWPVITLSKWSNLQNLSTISLLSAIFIISILSYEYIEQLFRSNENMFLNKNLFITTFIISISLFGILTYLNQNVNFQTFVGSNPGVFSRYDYTPIYLDKECHHPDDIDNAIRDCLMSDNNKKKIYLIGDSHATNYVDNLNLFTEKNPSYELKYLVEWGFIRTLIGYNSCGDSSPCLDNSFELFLDFFEQNLNPDDILIFSTSRDWYLDYGTIPRKVNIEKYNSLEKKLVEIKFKAIEHGAKLIFIDDIPKICLQENVNFIYDIIENGNIEKCTIQKSLSLQEREFLTSIYLKLINKDVSYIDPHNLLCKDSYCSLIYRDNLKFIYGDLTGHITQYGSSLIQPLIEDELNKLISD